MPSSANAKASAHPVVERKLVDCLHWGGGEVFESLQHAHRRAEVGDLMREGHNRWERHIQMQEGAGGANKYRGVGARLCVRADRFAHRALHDLAGARARSAPYLHIGGHTGERHVDRGAAHAAQHRGN